MRRAGRFTNKVVAIAVVAGKGNQLALVKLNNFIFISLHMSAMGWRGDKDKDEYQKCWSGYDGGQAATERRTFIKMMDLAWLVSASIMQ